MLIADTVLALIQEAKTTLGPGNFILNIVRVLSPTNAEDGIH